MAELIKFQVQRLPGVILVGKARTYGQQNSVKGENGIPAFWGQCFENQVFDPLEQQQDFVYDPSYVGAMLDFKDGGFSYVVGMLMKEGAQIPEGYFSRVLDAADIAVGWIKGGEAEVCAAAHSLTENAMRENGYASDRMPWCMEVYNCPRYTTPDENGDVVLDYYIPVCKEK